MRGDLLAQTKQQQEEMIEKVAFPTFVETKEYSARVTGKTIYTGPSMVVTEGSGTTWLPEVFGESVARLIKGLPVEELEVIEEKIQQAISEGYESIGYEGEHIAASPTTESRATTPWSARPRAMSASRPMVTASFAGRAAARR